MGLLFVIQKHSEAYCNIVQISYELSFVYFVIIQKHSLPRRRSGVVLVSFC